MGMDAIRYEVVRAISPEEVKTFLSLDFDSYNANVQCILVTPRIREWMEDIGIDESNICVEKEFHWDAWLSQNKEYEGCMVANAEVSYGTPTPFIEVAVAVGDNIVVEQGLVFKDVEKLYVEVKRINYIRKPFRYTEYPIVMEGKNIVFNVNNFSDKGDKALSTLQKIDAEKTKNAHIEVCDLKQLKMIKQFSYDLDMFEEALIKKWQPNHYVLFHW